MGNACTAGGAWEGGAAPWSISMNPTGPAEPTARAGTRPSRRNFMATTAATVALAGARAASAASDTLVWDIAAGPQYVDPVMGTSAQANVMVLQNVYERLVWYDGAGTQPIPWLASGWEVKDGGRRFIFKLRKGIKFHDGAEFDATAVKFSFD